MLIRALHARLRHLGRLRYRAQLGHLGRLRQLGREHAGAAAVEFALILPVLILVALGAVEISLYALMTLKVQHAADTVADLIAREPDLSATILSGDLDALRYMLAPYTNLADRVAIVTCAGVRGGGAARVLWQKRGAGSLGSASAVGAVGGTASLPASLTVRDGETVIVAELFFRYHRSLLGLMPDATLRRVAYYRPRLGVPDTL